jgi:hypothetical protein
MLPTDDLGGAFADGEDQDYDVVIGDEIEGEDVAATAAPPAGVSLSKEDLAAIIGSRGSSEVSEGFAKLAESLQRQGPANVAPMQDDFDPKALEEELWKPGKAAEVITKLAARVSSQQTSQNAIATQAMEKQLLKLDPETSEVFKKYEKDIEQRVQGLPPQYRFQPNVYSQVYKVIMQEKQGEIIEDRAMKMAQGIAEKAVAEALERAGVKAAPSGAAMQVETGTISAPRAKQTLRLTTNDVQNMIESQMDPKDADQVRSYLKWKQQKGIK